MNMKRMIAIFAAVMMLVCLFSACSNQPAATTDNSSSSSSTTTDNKTDAATTDNKTDDKKDDTETTTTDTPAENDELVTISWMGRGNQDNLNAAREANYANLAKYDEIMAQYGFVIESSQMDTSVYASTIHSLRAAGQLPDSFISYGMIDNDTIVSWIEAGIFVSCTDMMAESTGNMAKFFADDGALKFAKAAATYTDGDWYYVFMTNDTARSIQLTESDGPLRAVIQVHGAYDVMIRQDWLDKLDIALPTTADEYFEACLAMNENDVNGNGQKDERIIMGLGTEYQYQGVGQWFGLPYIDFIEDPSSGEVEVGLLKEGFGDWATYLNKFYSESIIYNNEGGHPWTNTATYLAENNVISWTCMQDTIWSSGITNSGDDNCNYQPMPIIQAVDGIAPRLICQEGAAAEFAVGFTKASISPADAAKLIDFAYSQELYYLYYFGIQGEAWDFNADGTVDNFRNHDGYTKGDIDNQYMPLTAMDNGFAGMVSYVPNPKDQDLWADNAHVYNSYAEALAAGEPYDQNGYDEAKWMALNDWNEESPCHKFMQYIADYGDANINWASYYTFVTLPTTEESEVMADYGNDLKTYLVEVSTKLVTGEYSVGDLQSYIDHANDTLHLQEYIDAQQGRVDRFMSAMGLK